MAWGNTLRTAAHVSGDRKGIRGPKRGVRSNHGKPGRAADLPRGLNSGPKIGRHDKITNDRRSRADKAAGHVMRCARMMARAIHCILRDAMGLRGAHMDIMRRAVGHRSRRHRGQRRDTNQQQHPKGTQENGVCPVSVVHMTQLIPCSLRRKHLVWDLAGSKTECGCV